MVNPTVTMVLPMMILTMTKHNISVIITAAGSSTRMGGGVKKEYLPLGEGTVLSNALLPFLNALDPFCVVITCPKNRIEESRKAVMCDKRVLEKLSCKKMEIVFTEGSYTRALSVKAALEKLEQCAPQTDYVLIHDGARPFCSEAVIKNVVEPLDANTATTPAVTPTDTQKVIDENGFITEHLERSKLAAVQTPQGFHFSKLLEAHRRIAEEAATQKIAREYTDDTEIWQKYCGKVLTVAGDPSNKKITYQEDM